MFVGVPGNGGSGEGETWLGTLSGGVFEEAPPVVSLDSSRVRAPWSFAPCMPHLTQFYHIAPGGRGKSAISLEVIMMKAFYWRNAPERP